MGLPPARIKTIIVVLNLNCAGGCSEILLKQGLTQANEARRDCPSSPNGFRRERTHHHFPRVCRWCVHHARKKAGQPPSRLKIKYNAHGSTRSGGSPIFCSFCFLDLLLSNIFP